MPRFGTHGTERADCIAPSPGLNPSTSSAARTASTSATPSDTWRIVAALSRGRSQTTTAPTIGSAISAVSTSRPPKQQVAQHEHHAEQDEARVVAHEPRLRAAELETSPTHRAGHRLDHAVHDPVVDRSSQPERRDATRDHQQPA